MSMYGIYQPYKVNRSLTPAEKKLKMNQGNPRKVKYFNCGESVIRLNSTCLETTDKFYKQKGIDNGWWVIASIIMLSLVIIGVARGIQLISSEGYMPLLRVLLLDTVFLGTLVFTGRIVLKEWFTWTHYPIRFNRKNQMVYIFRTDGTVLSVPWKEIYFTQDKEPGPLREWCIRGHIIDKDKETVLETFSLGICENKESLPEYWEFIRCYMEEDLVAELAELVVICPPIENRKEGYLFGLQNLIYMDSRFGWIYFPFKLPLQLEASVCRYIASQTSKIPRWPQDVLDACRPDADDPVNVSAANNPKDMWRLVFANQSLTNWQEKYERMATATNRIHAALAKKYGNKPVIE